jgi:hypothetical protein
MIDDERPTTDPRADRRDRRREAKRDRMKKHGATTAAVYRNAIIKRLRKKAGK